MPHTPTAYAGIGSRQTPIDILALMEILATQLAQQGHVLRSGGALGADQAFEKGCDLAQGAKEIYIPWDGFQGRRANARKDVEAYGTFAGVSQEAMTLASEIHPNWPACSNAARSLHARNCYQILGRNLDTPVSDVLCYTVGGRGKGGTGQAIRIARHFGIPVYDLGDPKVLNQFLELIH